MSACHASVSCVWWLFRFVVLCCWFGWSGFVFSAALTDLTCHIPRHAHDTGRHTRERESGHIYNALESGAYIVVLSVRGLYVCMYVCVYVSTNATPRHATHVCVLFV
uniref:Uncharacterized protein n=1 Tax=Vitrella brassicaformis TaxID=1169539 RepID=A0A7S1K1W6_9ALVE|mmetsp:Transcript_34424/g.85315  ORF Transcript_34424/g.85315 Transcript_34424/m.85315 type:complete len:107 (+) Transcript_34424:145-465(+)